MSRVLFITDLHIPFMRKGFLTFAKGVQRKWRCNMVVFGGDLLDLHRISRHTSHPDSVGAAQEYDLAMKQVKELYKVFPKVKAIIGNHDDRYYIQAGEQASIPSNMLKTIEELTGSPKGWEWADKHTLDDILYIHGTAYSGDNAIVSAINSNCKSVVMGHLHTQLKVIYRATPDEMLLGVVGGCGMDSNAYAAAYAKFRDKKPVVGCSVIIEGKEAYAIPMDLGKKVIRRNK